MAIVEIDIGELKKLVGKDLSKDQIIDDLFSLGVELENEKDGILQLEVVPDRPDRLSVEGLGRSLRQYYGIERGVYIPETEDPEKKITVEDSVSNIRPYIVGAVVRGVDISGILDSLIQLQEKLHSTLGRKRKKGAIGLHDLSMLKGDNIIYRAIDPDSDSFVPLSVGDMEMEEMTPRSVLEDHPTGREYLHILENKDKVPAIYDDIGLFSFPPIINGTRTEVRDRTRDLLLELTGEDEDTLDTMLNILIYALDSRGGTIEKIEIEYKNKKKVKPNLSTTTKQITKDKIESILGINFQKSEITDLLERSGLSPRKENNHFQVDIPPYRSDIMHTVDIVDDIGRTYGFDNLDPSIPDASTVGELTENTRLENAVREALVGLGFQDLLNFVLTNSEEEKEKMLVDKIEQIPGAEGKLVHIENPYSNEYSIMRGWLTPSLLFVLSNNTHREYPQNISEIGMCFSKNPSYTTGIEEKKHIAALVCSSNATYEKAKSKLSLLVKGFGCSLKTPRTTHPSFIEGRVAKIRINKENCGIIGEVSPEVLENKNIEMPVAGFEFELNTLK